MSNNHDLTSNPSPRSFIWAIIFGNSAHVQPGPVVINSPPAPHVVHGLDPEFSPIMDVLHMCLYLPRGELDYLTKTASIALHESNLDRPHAIRIVPFRRDGEVQSVIEAALTDVDMIFMPSELETDFRGFEWSQKPQAPIVGFSELDFTALSRVWNRFRPSMPFATKPPFEAPPAIGANVGITLPLLWFMRDIDPDTTFQHIEIHDSIGDTIRSQLALRQALKKEAVAEQSPFPHSPRIPLVITASGIPPRQRRHQQKARHEELPCSQGADVIDEGKAISFLGIHRAIARSGLGLSVSIPHEAYSLLVELEGAASARTPVGKKILGIFSKLGHTLASAFSDELIEACKAAKDLTLFSDFPLGLAILPGQTAPLSCGVPTWYRPLTPLTRCLQFECNSPRYVNLTENIRILIVECTSPSDKIHNAALSGWKFVSEWANSTPGCSLCLEFAVSVQNLREILAASVGEYDILIISAHGSYHPERPAQPAGIWVHDEICVDLQARLPPLVIFSSCAVWPRTSGSVSIADLALRGGAVAVVGTLFPILVNRNATMLVRLLANMHATQTGELQRHTFAECMHWTLASGAVHDITGGGRSLSDWAHGAGEEGYGRIGDFKRKYSRGNLRLTHIYEDTERVLHSMASDESERPIRQALNQRNFVPESLYYTVIGFPERIYLRHTIASP